LLALAAEVALADRGLDEEAFDRREARRKREFARRLLLDIGFKNDAVGRAAFLALDLEIFLEIAEAVDAPFGALHRKAVEGIAFVEAEFAADHLVLRQRIAVDVDPLHVGTRAF